MSLYTLQTKVHVGKDKRNEFGGYNYRTAEGILAAIKVALDDGETIVVTDDLQEIAGQIFVTSTAILTMADGTRHEAKGHAMHPLTKKGMDPSQITGSASSYARKYALSGLMALDDGSADPDAAKERYEPEPEPEPKQPPMSLTNPTDTKAAIIAALMKRTEPAEVKLAWQSKTIQSVLPLLPEDMRMEVTALYEERAQIPASLPTGLAAE